MKLGALKFYRKIQIDVLEGDDGDQSLVRWISDVVQKRMGNHATFDPDISHFKYFAAWVAKSTPTCRLEALTDMNILPSSHM